MVQFGSKATYWNNISTDGNIAINDSVNGY